MSVTFAPALDGALTVNRHAAMAREVKLLIRFAPEGNPVKPNRGRTGSRPLISVAGSIATDTRCPDKVRYSPDRNH
jgi:hypothetical protein